MNPAPQRFCKTTVSDEPIALLGRQRKSAGRTLSKLFWKPASQNGMPRTRLEKIRRSCGSAMPGSAPATRTPSSRSMRCGGPSSAESRAGNECGSKCKAGGAEDHRKKHTKKSKGKTTNKEKP